jgi:hypothetical protein
MNRGRCQPPCNPRTGPDHRVPVIRRRSWTATAALALPLNPSSSTSTMVSPCHSRTSLAPSAAEPHDCGRIYCPTWSGPAGQSALAAPASPPWTCSDLPGDAEQGSSRPIRGGARYHRHHSLCRAPPGEAWRGWPSACQVLVAGCEERADPGGDFPSQLSSTAWPRPPPDALIVR